MIWRDVKIIDRAGRPVTLEGNRWTVWSAGRALDLDWSLLRILPGYILEPAVAYTKHMIETQSVSSVAGMFKALCLLARCPSLKKMNRASEVLFAELREAAANDYSVVHRYRKFHYWAVMSGCEGFDRDVAEAIYSVKVGQRKTAGPFHGQCPPFTRSEWDWIGETLATAPADLLTALEKNLLTVHYLFAHNPGPISLLRREDIKRVDDPEGETKWFIDIPRHKKRHAHERAAFRSRRTTAGVAEGLNALAAENARKIEHLGLTDRIAVPIFMRDSPRDRYLSEDCPVQEYAMHMNGAEARGLLQRAVDKLCDWKKRDRFNASPRRFRRTRLLLHRLAGRSDAVVADLADHSSTRILVRYAVLGFHVVKRLDVLMAEEFAQLRREFESELDPRPRLEALGVEMLRKSKVFA